MNENNSKLIGNLSGIAMCNDPIDPSLYEKYDVKRGLRNANGTGVLGNEKGVLLLVV